MINTLCVDKIESIRAKFPLLEPTLQPYSFTDIDFIIPSFDIIFDHFEKLTRGDLMKIISVMNKTTWVSAQRKGPSVGICISKKIRFYKAVQNFLKKNFFVNLLLNIVYYIYIDLHIHIFIPN